MVKPRGPFGDIYRGKRVLVTGHTGFKGAWLSAWLLELGAEVHGLSLDLVSQPNLFEVLGLEQRLRHSYGDIRSQDAVARRVAEVRPDFVFHLAAQSLVRWSYDDPVATFDTNVLGTVHLLEALRGPGSGCVAVFITSDKCYLNKELDRGYREEDELGGLDPYSGSKGAAELAIRAYCASFFSRAGSPTRIATARAGNVIGGGDWAADRIVPDCIRAWSRGAPVEVRHPASTRPWQHVLEPLSGYLCLGAALAAGGERHGESYNFGPPAEMSATVAELIEALAAHWTFAARHERMKVAPRSDFREAALLQLNCEKAGAQLQWRPALEFSETMRLTASWYDSFYHGGGSGIAGTTARQIAEYVALAGARHLSWAA
jgi:CDP-glucose 4,6-dehydratase